MLLSSTTETTLDNKEKLKRKRKKLEIGSTEAFKSENYSGAGEFAQSGCVFDIAIDESGELRDSGKYVIWAVRHVTMIRMAPSPRHRTSIDHFLRIRQADSLFLGLTGLERGMLSSVFF